MEIKIKIPHEHSDMTITQIKKLKNHLESSMDSYLNGSIARRREIEKKVDAILRTAEWRYGKDDD